MAKPQAKAATSAKSAAATLQGKESTALSVVQSGPVAFALPAGMKVKRILTMPSLVLKEAGAHRTLMFVSEIRVSKVVDKDAKREPANIADVGDVETGEAFIFLVPSVVKSNLERDYPDGSYKGLTFFIQNLGKRTESQRYNDFRILEVENDATAE